MLRPNRVASPCGDALRSPECSERSRILAGCALLAVWVAVTGTLQTKGAVLFADDGAAAPLHQVIDAMISADWQAKGIQPAGPSSDAEFLRRIYLDLIGAVPTTDEARAFLDDPSPEKREKLIDQLLEREEYARHMQRQFDVMLMERRGDKNIPRAEWQAFLRSSFAANKPWDQIAREILAADGTEEKIRPAAKFYLDRDGETNLLTRDVGRLFLGIDLECAQCHDHPTVLDYLQEDYYGIFAYLNRSYVFNDKENKKVFFAEKAEGDVTFKSVFDPNTTNATRPRLPRFEQIEEPSYEKGQEYEVAPDKDNKVRPVPKFSRRKKLAEDLPRGENSLFVKNIVNRLWAMTMGRGLVDPVDMHHAENTPSHPELLQVLADRFVAMGFDVKQMLRELTRSRVYQLSSELPEGVTELPEDRFAARRLKPLSPEQLAWSIMQASGLSDRKSTRLNSSHTDISRMPSSA